MHCVAQLMTILLLVGCKPDPDPVPLITMVDATLSERVELAPAVGYGEVEVPVRVLNRYGAAVASEEVELSVSGPTAMAELTTISIDPTGYGEIEVVTEGAESFTVSIEGSSETLTLGDPVECWSVAAALPTWNLRTSWLWPAELDGVQGVDALLEAVAIVTELDVWYLGAGPDALPHKVLTMPDPIVEAEAVHVDNDGIPDLLVRSGDEVVLLRGGMHGMSWGAGFAAEGLEIVGASVGDVNGDSREDLGFALMGSEGAWMVVMGGDGAWSFEELLEHRFEPSYSVADIELSHSDDDGMAELALITSDSKLMRYYWSEGESAWAETYPSSLETHLAEPASFLGAADLNAAGAEDPILLSYDQDGVQQSAIFYTLDGDTTQYQKSYDDPQWDLNDLTADGIADVLALEDGDLHLIHFLSGEGNPDFSYHTVGGVHLHSGTDDDDDPEVGPIAAGLIDDDRLPDLVMATDALHLFPGKEVESAWAARDGRWTSYDLQLLAEPALADLDDEAGLDSLAAWVTSYSVPVLRTWWIEPDPHGEAPTLERRGEILFEDGATPLAVLIADGQVYGLIDFEGVQLVSMVLTGSDTYEELDRVVVDGATLVQGSFAEGAAVAVIAADGGVSYRDASLAEVGTDALGSYGCVAAADTDGDGLDELVTGLDAGCSVLAVDLDGDGADEIVSSTDSLVVAWGDAEHGLEGRGALAAHDLDRDGQPEIMAVEGGRMWIHRSVGDGFAPGLGLHGVGIFLGTPAIGDVTGDGVDDMVVLGEEKLLRLLWGE
jgi:hypothetical protein